MNNKINTKIDHKKEYQLRRNSFFKKIGPKGVAIIFAAKEKIRSGNESYPYRQNSDFYYLTGYAEANAIALFIAGHKNNEFIIFNQTHSVEIKRWLGANISQNALRSKFGATKIFPINEIDTILPPLLRGCENIYFHLGHNKEHDLRAVSWINKAKTYSRKNNIKTSPKIINLGEILNEMRLKKSAHELTLIRQAAKITARGFLRAMQKCKPNIYEFELEAELLYEFMRLGGRYEAFKSIIAGGVNACTLHYQHKHKKLTSNELVLIDAGAEYKYYCSDISRTFPVSGKFAVNQRAIYEAVLDIQKKVIAKIRPGIRFDILQHTAELLTTKHLVRLGLLKGKINKLIANRAFKDFFMHKIGHWIGLDVHDVGDYQTNNKWRTLEPGMVLTIEPGIYITSNNKVDKKWKNIGVRIEDVVLVTKNGHEILTNMVPKTVEEIETLMGRDG